MVKTIVGSFDTLEDATRASADLKNAGFLPSDINVVGNNVAGADITTPALAGGREEVNESSAVASGAVAGGAIGGAAGIAISLMGLAVPGIGPILAAGALATALAGAGAGAVAGGLIGGLADMGVSEADAHIYAESVRRGGALVTVTVDESRSREAEGILRGSGAIDIAKRVQEWRKDGWTSYDADAAPFSLDQIERERTRYRSKPSLPR